MDRARGVVTSKEQGNRREKEKVNPLRALVKIVVGKNSLALVMLKLMFAGIDVQLINT